MMDETKSALEQILTKKGKEKLSPVEDCILLMYEIGSKNIAFRAAEDVAQLRRQNAELGGEPEKKNH